MKPYIYLLENHEPVTTTNTKLVYQSNNTDIPIELLKSKIFYQNFKKQKYEVPYQHKVWDDIFGKNLNYGKIYQSKITLISETKLAEFSYKCLHLVLSCESNLFKWKISQDPKCSICNVKHDIPHLLLFCNKAKRAWSHLKNSTGLDLTFEQILTGILID